MTDLEKEKGAPTKAPEIAEHADSVNNHLPNAPDAAPPSLEQEFIRELEERFGELESNSRRRIRAGAKGRARRKGEAQGKQDIQWRLSADGHGMATAWDRPEMGALYFKSLSAHPETSEERRKREDKWRAELQALIEAAKKRCNEIIRDSKPAPSDHPYLTKKKIGPEYLLLGGDGRLVIPVLAPGAEVMSVQFINDKGEKRFLSDAPQAKGMYAPIPGSRKNFVVICEGWATGKSISEAFGGEIEVRCALSARNMAFAAEVAVEDHSHRNLRVLIAGDADEPGREAAEAARKRLAEKRVQVVTAFPAFPDGVKDVSDFNDLAAHCGPAEVARQIREASEQAPKEELFRPVLQSIADIARAQPPEFVIDDLLPVGMTLIAAPPKSGKSMLALQLAAAVASSGKFLGHEIPRRSKVIYLALDNDAAWRIKNRLMQMHGGDDRIFRAALDDWFFAYDGPWEPGNYKAIRDLVASVPGTRLLVIDVLLNVQRGMQKHEGAYSYDYSAIRPITEIANEFGIAIAGVTHTNKRQDVSSDLDRVTGSTGVTAAGSSIWMLRRTAEDETARVLSITGRDVHDRELSLRFDPLTATFQFQGDASDLLSPAEKKVARVLVHGPKRYGDLVSASGVSQQRVAELLKRLVSKGFVIKDGNGEWKLVRPLRSL